MQDFILEMSQSSSMGYSFMLNKYKNLLIQPLIGQYKKSEYLDDIIVKTNKKISKMYKKK